jgi:hypothetical protein
LVSKLSYRGIRCAHTRTGLVLVRRHGNEPGLVIAILTPARRAAAPIGGTVTFRHRGHVLDVVPVRGGVAELGARSSLLAGISAAYSGDRGYAPSRASRR